MKIYNILTSDKQGEFLEKHSLFIEERFSFSALFFQSLWFLYYRMWLPALAVLFTHIGLLLLLKAEYIAAPIFIELELVVFLLVASFANTWRINNLEGKDYQSTCVVARNIDEAKLRFYQLSLEKL